jgi:CRISPR-associated endonuclease Csn1
MKGKRTARQFILDDGGKQVPSKERLSLFTAKTYDTFVDRLDAKGHIDDIRRKKSRKALLATTDFEDKELGFTEGQLTQTSQLMKLAMGAIRHKLPGTAIHPVPGPVTAEIRKAWKLVGTLALACPEVLDSEGNVRPKDEIRGLTHLHHALDAATLAIAAHYFPLTHRGQDQKGKIWQALLRRYRNSEEKEFLYRTGIFERYTRKRRDKQGNEYTEPDVRLADLPAGLKNALARSLAECRVMQHLPSDRSGAKAELTTWGIVSIEGEGEDARVQLRQQASAVEDGRRKVDRKTREERAGKLLGTHPKDDHGKLKAIRGAMIIGENYGLALDPKPEVIPFHNVQQRLEAIRARNSGKPVRVLRNGMLIRLNSPSGIWQVRSIKSSKRDGILLDLTSPHMIPVKEAGKAWCKRDMSIQAALKAGLEIMPRVYVGHRLTDHPSD